MNTLRYIDNRIALLQKNDNVLEENKAEMLKFDKESAAQDLKPQSRLVAFNFFKVFGEWSQKPFRELTKDDLISFVVFLDKFKPSTKFVHKLRLKQFMKYLNAGTIPPTISWLRIQAPKTPVKTEQLLNEEDVERLVAACSFQRDRALIRTLFSSGFRQAELLSMQLKNCVDDGRGYLISCNESKTAIRTVRLDKKASHELGLWLQAHPMMHDHSAPVWISIQRQEHNKIGVLSHNGIATLLQRIGKKAGLSAEKRLNCHNFRHSRCTIWRKNLPTGIVEQLSGWTAGSAMVKYYSHLCDSDANDQLDKLYKLDEEKEPVSDEFLFQLFSNEEIRRYIVKKIREMNLVQKLMATT